MVLLLACDGLLVRIRVNETAETTIPARSVVEGLLDDFGFAGFTGLDITASQELANQGVQPGDIVDTRVVRFDLRVLNPDDGDLSFLDALSVFVEAPGLDRVRIAHLDDFPEGEAEVAMALDDVDITDHVASESMTVTTEASGRRPERATTVEADFGLSVGVTGQGACNAVQGGG